YDISLAKAISRLLVLTGAAVLVVPPGWCCGLVAAECREGIPAERVVPPPVMKASCCHQQHSDSGQPTPKPAKPVVPSCCERLPSDAPESRWPLPDAAVPDVSAVIERAETGLALTIRPGRSWVLPLLCTFSIVCGFAVLGETVLNTVLSVV